MLLIQAKKQSKCLDCTSGNYCPDQGMTHGKECEPGHYCPGGSKNMTQCPPVSCFFRLMRTNSSLELRHCSNHEFTKNHIKLLASSYKVNPNSYSFFYSK